MCELGRKVLIKVNREDANYLSKGDVGYFVGSFYHSTGDYGSWINVISKNRCIESENDETDLFEENEIEYI